MKSAYKSILLLFLSLFLIETSAHSKDNFKPWDSDVLISDENIDADNICTGSNCSELHKHSLIINGRSAGSRHRNIYNGAQGGAFFLIRFFQIVISPQDGPSCRFDPVCSTYAKLAVEKYGALLGAMLAGERLLRCNPYSPPGKNPIPCEVIGK